MTGGPTPALKGPNMGWSEDARAVVEVDGEAVISLFPAAARHARAQGLDGDEVRKDLLAAIPGSLEDVTRVVTALYQRGDSLEKQAVLSGLPLLDQQTAQRAAVGDALVGLLRDALRTNDTRLVGAALGPYAARHLDDASWRRGVVKAIFMGIPLDGVADLAARVDDELRRMVSDFAAERRAAGREVPADAYRIVPHLPARNADTSTSGRDDGPAPSSRSAPEGASRIGLAGRSHTTDDCPGSTR